MNTLLYYLGYLSDEENELQKSKNQQAVDKKQCKQCNEYKNWLLSYSPSVRFMADQVGRVGGNINANNIVCAKCDDMKSGGFHPELGILLCQNKLYSRNHAEDTLTHEMVHAYDHCRFQVDWGNLRHHACSEIRASSLSGECRMMNQMVKNGFWKFSKGHQDCVRRRAALSVRGNPACPDEKTADIIVNQVFESCFGDTRPFDEIYR